MSNLSFISKLIEKAVANQLNSYINEEGLSDLNQSVYKRLHSTKTAHLKIQNDIASSMDSGKAFALTLLDLLANSMISSRIDNCNSLLYGVNKYNVAKLQKIQNALCRIVFRLDKTSHVTSYLQKLYWLPISYRILFKYNLITVKAIKFSQPTYLSS